MRILLVEDHPPLAESVAQALKNAGLNVDLLNDGVAADLPTLIDTLGYGDATVREMSLSPIEYLVRWITDPVFASLLILAGLFLIIADALFAGFGIAAVGGVACLGLFFWGHTLAGLAGWEDMVLVAIGIVLIAVEIFVIPGFGIAGVLGIGALGTSIWYSFADSAAALRALAITAVVLIGGLILLYRSLDRIARWRHIILKTDMGGEAYAPVAVAERRKLLGKVGAKATTGYLNRILLIRLGRYGVRLLRPVAR